jgi:hypothetical protein
MSVAYSAQQWERFLQVLRTVEKKAAVLAEVRERLTRAGLIAANWVSDRANELAADLFVTCRNLWRDCVGNFGVDISQLPQRSE